MVVAPAVAHPRPRRPAPDPDLGRVRYRAPMKTILFVAALACIVGCDKKKRDDGGTAASNDPCTAAIDQAIDAMIAGRQQAIDARAAAGEAPPAGMMAQMTEVSNKLRTVMTTRCKADAWPAPVIACFAKASDQPSIKQCREQLSQESAQKLQLEIVKVMSAGRPGGPGGPGMPHGGPMGGPAGGAAPAAGGSAAPADGAAPSTGAGSTP